MKVYVLEGYWANFLSDENFSVDGVFVTRELARRKGEKLKLKYRKEESNRGNYHYQITPHIVKGGEA